MAELSTWKTSSKSNLEMRTHCSLCEWVGEWVRTPQEAMTQFAGHLNELHRDVLMDPTKFAKARTDEFRYATSEGAGQH